MENNIIIYGKDFGQISFTGWPNGYHGTNGLFTEQVAGAAVKST
jgi:hypothetical protein